VPSITAGLGAPLAEIRVPIFILATFDTDYLLVQDSRFDEEIARLGLKGIGSSTTSRPLFPLDDVCRDLKA
jgi:hypothetical protein